jgi:hypothetical protein
MTRELGPKALYGTVIATNPFVVIIAIVLMLPFGGRYVYCRHYP